MGAAGAGVSARTFDFPGAPLRVTTAPASVDPLTGTAPWGWGPGSVRVAWDAPASDGGTPVSSFQAWRSFRGQDFVLVGRTDGGARDVTDPGLYPGAPDAARVVAVNLARAGAASGASRTLASPGSLDPAAEDTLRGVDADGEPSPVTVPDGIEVPRFPGRHVPIPKP